MAAEQAAASSTPAAGARSGSSDLWFGDDDKDQRELALARADPVAAVVAARFQPRGWRIQ